MRCGDGPVDVLLVEDTPGDVRLTKEAFHHHGLVRLQHAWDGLEAMAILRREGVYADVPRPDLIIMDLNLPKMDGREALALIKHDPELKCIPTIILTTSDVQADILLCYKLGANCYLQKPQHWDAFDKLIKQVNQFWLARPKLPGTAMH
jgi:two-component system, chemotaxis family, response regulator Rcp1